MSEEEYAQYKDLKFSTENLQSELEQQGFLVDENINEIGVFNAYSKLNSKRMNPMPSITVTPTMECNARCFYCYEEGVRQGRMKKESAENIVSFIKALDTSKGVFVTWFGGEPLMNQEWMDYFADMLRAEKINFSAFMISNGSKIDESVIKKMKENWNISSIQITFDGDCEEYVKRKNYLDQNESIFFQMIKK
jgi:sulfatase maturation enzyme AslB (radical SAM superfamily)